MKRIIILFILMLTVAVTMQAQQPRHYGDTIYGRNPNYFYQWWFDDWYARDTIDSRFTDITGSMWHPAAIDRTDFDYFFESQHPGDYSPHDGLISLERMYTPHGINIIGLAVAADAIGYYEPWLQELLQLYDARHDTLVLLKSIPWHALDSFYYMKVECHCRPREPLGGYSDCCSHIERYFRTVRVKEFYFDRPVYVEDSFYVGRTNYSYYSIPNNQERMAIANYRQFYTYGCGTCPTYWHHRKIYGHSLYNQYLPNSLVPATDTLWHDVDEPAYGMVFAIYRDSVPPPCAVPTGFRAERQQNSCLSVRWDADTTHLSWELSYGVLGSPRDSYTTIVCDSDHYTFCGLHDYETYAVYMRAICNDEGSLHSDWSDINLLYLGMPIAGIENVADDGILLRPNPADRQVTVSAPLPLRRVEVYDMAGRMVEAHQPNGTTLQIDLKAYPTGTYLVKVTTTNGTTTKKLVVR